MSVPWKTQSKHPHVSQWWFFSVPLLAWIWRSIHIHTSYQMVSVWWGMHTEKCLHLTRIPWRLSLRCGMLFLSWDSGVLAWLPEGWSSARQRRDFSPLGIWLPWLPAPTGPKQRMRNMLIPMCVSRLISESAFLLVHETHCILESSWTSQGCTTVLFCFGTNHRICHTMDDVYICKSDSKANSKLQNSNTGTQISILCHFYPVYVTAATSPIPFPAQVIVLLLIIAFALFALLWHKCSIVSQCHATENTYQCGKWINYPKEDNFSPPGGTHLSIVHKTLNYLHHWTFVNHNNSQVTITIWWLEVFFFTKLCFVCIYRGICLNFWTFHQHIRLLRLLFPT